MPVGRVYICFDLLPFNASIAGCQSSANTTTSTNTKHNNTITSKTFRFLNWNEMKWKKHNRVTTTIRTQPDKIEHFKMNQRNSSSFVSYIYISNLKTLNWCIHCFHWISRPFAKYILWHLSLCLLFLLFVSLSVVLFFFCFLLFNFLISIVIAIVVFSFIGNGIQRNQNGNALSTVWLEHFLMFYTVFGNGRSKWKYSNNSCRRSWRMKTEWQTAFFIIVLAFLSHRRINRDRLHHSQWPLFSKRSFAMLQVHYMKWRTLLSEWNIFILNFQHFLQFLHFYFDFGLF